jgi:hypothetical protein
MTPDTHRSWRLYYEPTPIPVRDFDWTALHPDYDAWTDDGVWTDNGLKAFAATRGELCAEIDAIEDDLAVALVVARPVDVTDAAAFPNIAEAIEHARGMP